MRRRRLLAAPALLALGPLGGGAIAATVERSSPEAALRSARPGLVVALRHAAAPGVFEPPGFRADVCGTQRNLSAEGREQAVRIGDWFRRHDLRPAQVRSSARCRCLDTARLAFGSASPWAPLDSFIGDRRDEPAQTAALRAELARRARERSTGFDVWVTHQVNLTALLGSGVREGESFVLAHDAASDGPVVLANWRVD